MFKKNLCKVILILALITPLYSLSQEGRVQADRGDTPEPHNSETLIID